MEKNLFTEWKLIYEGKTYESSCPNDVLTDLYKGGVIPDPYFDKNAEMAREYLKKPAVYEAHFALEGKPKALRLHFDGIDTFAKIYLNDNLLGETKNMFLAYDFDGTAFAVEGDNIIKVALSPIYDHLDNKEHGKALFSTKRLQVRKAQCHFGWDWAPDLPGYGIYLPSYYCVDDESRLYDLYLNPHNDGLVEGTAFVKGEGGSLFVKTDGQDHGPFSVNEGVNSFSFRIDSPRLWFPNGYGEQPLYKYKASLKYKDGHSSSINGHFAFREIKTIERQLDDGRLSFGFMVNGSMIFAKGSNWVPLSNQTGSIPDSSYVYLLNKAAEAHYSMLRVWGGGIYEKEIFYDLCDELGILVYQDFMFSCQGVPAYEGFMESISKEADYQLRRLRKHPCLAFLAGGNELYFDKKEENNSLNATLYEACQRLVPAIRYVPSSPFGYENNLWASTSGDVHKSVFEIALENDDVVGFEKYLDANRSSFFTECTCLGSCKYSSLKKFLPEKSIWPLSSSVDYHFTKNPYALDPKETFAKKELRLAESFYGPVKNGKDFAKKSMLAQALILRKEIVHARADENAYGHMNWMYNDDWGNGTWSLIDAYMNPKAAYYASKRSFSSLLLAFTFNKGKEELVAINDEPLPIEGELKLTYGNVQGTIVKVSKRRVKLPANERQIVSYDSLPEADYCYAEILSGGVPLSSDTLFFKPLKTLEFSTDVFIDGIEEKCGGVFLTIKANKYGHFVHFASKNKLDPSEDYFDIGQDGSRIVYIKGIGKDEVPKLQILTFADDFDD